MTTNSNLKKLNRKDLMSVFWRSCHQDASWNYERQQNLAAGYTMCKVIKKLYADDWGLRGNRHEIHHGSRRKNRINHRGNVLGAFPFFICRAEILESRGIL